MIVLFSIYLYSIIGLIIEKFSLKNAKDFKILKWIYLVSLLFLLTLITGTRENTGGTDYVAYKIFYNLKIGENPWSYDLLFVSLKNIFKTLELNYNTFLFGISLISHIMIYLFLKKVSEFPLTILCLFISNNYLWQNFTILRSALSIYFFWYSLNYFNHNKRVKTIIFWIISCGFHKGALPLLFLFLFLKIKIKIKNKKNYILSILIAFIISAYLPNFLSSINLEIISPYLDEALKPVQRGFLLLIFEKILMFTYIFSYRKDIVDQKYNIYYNLAFLDVIILILTYRIPSFTRYGHYFAIGFYILIGEILGRKWKKGIKYSIVNILFLLYLLLKFINTIVRHVS